MAGTPHPNDHASLPSRGKVQEVRKQWAVHEDGALAYKMQNKEINEHYGLNRFHRQLVREDIPVAKFVQSEEELRQQEERLRQLEILKAQAEEDARVAKKISRHRKREKTEVVNRVECEDLDDEELARQLQEKEKKKYERHLERKKERKLKKDRQILEEALAKDLEEARLTQNAENGGDRVSASMESLNLQGVSATRVTPSGCIEDDGDFSDFYNLPDEMDEFTRLEIQASQDEELARLLQDQEHKRTKAKVDPEKLRRIEHRDEQLARIIQEQEKLRLKKAKLKHQARKEALRQISVESMPLGASANSLKQQKPLPSGSMSATAASDFGHHRYRSNSYTQACDSPPSPPRTPPPGHLLSDGRGQLRAQSDQSIASVPSNTNKNQQYLKNQHVMTDDSPSLVQERSTCASSGRGLSTLESARQIAAGNPEGILAIQTSQKIGSSSQKDRSISHQERVITSHVSNIDTTHGQQGSRSRSTRELSDPYKSGRHPHIETVVYSQPYKPHTVTSEFELRPAGSIEGQHWLDGHGGAGSGSSSGSSHRHHVQQQSPRSGFYTDREEEDQSHESPHPSGLAGFNIAAAIDPTYQRRHPEASFLHETQTTSHVPYSLPQADGALEWDPNLRGSLRKTKTPIHVYQGPTTGGSLDHRDTLSGQQVLSSWQPVQGQRRRDPGSRNKSQKQNLPGADGKTNCKQQ